MATASKHRTSGKLSRQTARQRRSTEKETQIRTPVFNGHGFLKHSFQPVIDTKHKELRLSGVVERAFFNSLSNLAALYGFEPLDVRDTVFPYNILLAYRHAALQVKASDPALQLLIMQDIPSATFLATAKQMDTGATLYYVPVRPLYELLQDRKNKKTAELLVSVFSYLYQIAHIPYYRDSRSYLHYTYERLEEWMTDNPSDWDEDDYTKHVSCFKSLSYYGDIIKRKIRNPYNLQQFANRVRHYLPQSTQDEKLHEVSRKFLALFQEFPNRSVMDNIHLGIVEPHKEERIYPDQYISFFWDYNDCLYHSLFESVNMEIQEIEITEEPLSIQLFNTAQEKSLSNELEFEKRFFALIHELNSLL